MAQQTVPKLIRQLRSMVGPSVDTEYPDAQLLERYVAGHDEAAFAALMYRYGRLVRAVCAHMLRCHEDVEDAVQATFLILARRAGSIRKRASLASWLHGVAFRTASNARQSAARRHNHEKNGQSRVPEEPVAEAALHELQALLDEEVERLPEKLRAPFVLCCLEGLSRTEAAQALAWKEGTVSGRLAQARERIREGLSRNGVTLSAALCATVIDPMPSAGASGMVVREVLAYAAGEASGISARAVSLAETTLACLTISPVKAIVAVVLTASVLGGGVGLLTARQEPKGDEQPVATNTSAVATPNSVKIDRLIQQLGSNRFAEREQATRTLEKIGEPALEALRKAAQAAEDREIKQRSGELVRHLGKELFREVRQFAGHALGVRVVAVSPDGRRALSSSFDTTVRLWDLKTGNTIRVFQGHAGSVEGVAFSPDGKRAVSGSVDGSVIVWDLETGQEIDHVAEHKARSGAWTTHLTAKAFFRQALTGACGSGTCKRRRRSAPSWATRTPLAGRRMRAMAAGQSRAPATRRYACGTWPRGRS
ncbi:MAG TPA: sigma-70 family RNA polymerase sigma factor [Gemmataceae bacterium]|jgi:RNA polymerase sigma factor (sigma-70 family)|nr:sigma-70 family RNA polymerase sigma factor [Gemmataceae bacterium]